MSKPLWVCIICRKDFTRKSSGKRHRDNTNIHNARPVIVRYIEYIIGRAKGDYLPPITPPRLQGGKTKQLEPHHFAIAHDSNNNTFNPTSIPDSRRDPVSRSSVGQPMMNDNYAPGPVYPHDNYNNNRNFDKNNNNFKTYGRQPSYQVPKHSDSEIEQQSFHKPIHDDKRPGYPKSLERMSKMEKLQEFERLSNKLYASQEADSIIRMARYYVFNLRDESLLDSQLKVLRDTERARLGSYRGQ
jgi:hypothetical protein